jgi:hypothetical protein
MGNPGVRRETQFKSGTKSRSAESLLGLGWWFLEERTLFCQE